jgi:hypothetical protein
MSCCRETWTGELAGLTTCGFCISAAEAVGAATIPGGTEEAAVGECAWEAACVIAWCAAPFSRMAAAYCA